MLVHVLQGRKRLSESVGQVGIGFGFPHVQASPVRASAVSAIPAIGWSLQFESTI